MADKIALTGVWKLRVTLQECHPPIWRRLVVPGDMTLHHLHWVLQVVMGWTNSHLHQFNVGETCYGLPSPDVEWEQQDERRAKVGRVAPKPGGTFVYEYDFGDSWTHDVVVEAVEPRNPQAQLPFCLEGERACPPEDCGGSHGYENLLLALKDPSHEEHESSRTWMGGDFESERFDAREVNRVLGFGRPRGFY